MAQQRFIAVGHQGLRMSSTDGVTWEHAVTEKKDGHIFYGCCHGGGAFVAVGKYGGEGLICTSADGVKWSDIQRFKGEKSPRFQTAAYGDGTHLAIGGDPGGVPGETDWTRSTDDGRTWSNVKTERSLTLVRLAFGNRRFVAAGYRGRVAVSPNGEKWTDAPDRKPTDTFIDIAFGRGIFVGVGLHGLRMTSRDGTRWTDKQTGREGEHINTILWTGDRFVGIGQGGTFFSNDGHEWERRDNTDAPVTATYGNGVFVGANWKGRIMRSTDALHWEQAHRSEHHVEALAFGG